MWCDYRVDEADKIQGITSGPIRISGQMSQRSPNQCWGTQEGYNKGQGDFAHFIIGATKHASRIAKESCR